MRNIFKRALLLLGMNTFAANLEAPYHEVVNSFYSHTARILPLYLVGPVYESQIEDQLS
jgi:hypothetical protein